MFVVQGLQMPVNKWYPFLHNLQILLSNVHYKQVGWQEEQLPDVVAPYPILQAVQTVFRYEH